MVAKVAATTTKKEHTIRMNKGETRSKFETETMVGYLILFLDETDVILSSIAKSFASRARWRYGGGGGAVGRSSFLFLFEGV